MKLVLIRWRDSHVSVGGWKELDDFSTEAPIVQSVGWLLMDSETTKVVVPHLIDAQEPHVPSQGCGEMAIPASAVVSMVELETPAGMNPARRESENTTSSSSPCGQAPV